METVKMTTTCQNVACCFLMEMRLLTAIKQMLYWRKEPRAIVLYERNGVKDECYKQQEKEKKMPVKCVIDL